MNRSRAQSHLEATWHMSRTASQSRALEDGKPFLNRADRRAVAVIGREMGARATARRNFRPVAESVTVRRERLDLLLAYCAPASPAKAGPLELRHARVSLPPVGVS